MSYRQLTPEEERLEEQVQAAWDAFLVQIQDAAEFVSQQRQIVLKYLEDTFEVSGLFSLAKCICFEISQVRHHVMPSLVSFYFGESLSRKEYAHDLSCCTEYTRP